VKKRLHLNVLRIISVTILFLGMTGSLGFMLYTGRNNKSVLLMLLFAIWILSPFIALLRINTIAKKWSAFSRISLFSLMIILSSGSLAGYSGLLNLKETKPAFVFLLIPLISWMLMVLVIPVAAALSRRFSQKEEQV
jgi:hypothetical protein